MAINRRNTLVGLGALAVGGGALAATGAFTQVEAERTVEVEVAGDAAALLGLDIPAASLGNDSDVVQIADGLLTIDFDAAGQGGTGGEVNLGARTTVGATDDNSNPSSIADEDEAFIIANNSNNPIDVGFDIDIHPDQTGENIDGDPAHDYLKLWTDVSDNAADINSVDFGNLVEFDIDGLPSGEVARVVIQIDTTTLAESDVDITAPLFDSPATITATDASP